MPQFCSCKYSVVFKGFLSHELTNFIISTGHDIHGQGYIIVHFKNEVGTTGDIRIISSIKPEGYVLGSKEFKLKVVFKYKFIDSVTFHAVDESGKGREILLNGKAELTLHPSVSVYDYSDVVVSVNPLAKGECTEA